VCVCVCLFVVFCFKKGFENRKEKSEIILPRPKKKLVFMVWYYTGWIFPFLLSFLSFCKRWEGEGSG